MTDSLQQMSFKCSLFQLGVLEQFSENLSLKEEVHMFYMIMPDTLKKRIIMTNYFIMTVNVTLYQYDWLHCLKQAPSPHHPLLVTSAK